MKRIVLFAVATLLAAGGWAVPASEACMVANTFWTVTLGMKGTLQNSEWGYSDAAYLFVADGGGWVIVAANDVARPILAYSTTTTLDPHHLPVATRGFLDIYRQETACADGVRDAEWDMLLNGGMLKDTEEEESVGPLLTTTWYQMSPYNQMCPSGCMTGCEATAMAQVLRYWSYPAFGEGSHSYNDAGGHGVQSADFGGTRYDWDNMPNRLTSGSSATEKQAVATLMYHCGVAVDMSYSPSLSGAVMTGIVPALTRYFRYSGRARYVAKGSMSNADWTDTLTRELRHHRPIIYGGDGPAGGHVFVCDGFDTRGYLHFNLGEDGDGDGYYQVGAITYGMYSFNSANDCVMGIEPEYGIYCNEGQLDFGRAASSQQLWVSTSDTCTAPWTAATSDSWISVSGTGFTHLGQMTVSVGENATGEERSGSVTLLQGDLGTTLTVLQAAYDPTTDYCPLTVEMGNSHNEPWAADAHLSFESLSGLVYGSAAHTVSGASSTTQVMVAPHDVMVRWHSGDGRDRYISYRIKNQHGEVLVDVENAFFDGADVLLSWPCVHVGLDDPPRTEATGATEVYDLMGRLVLRTKDRGDRSDRVIQRGVYIVRTVTDRGVSVKKTLIINH